MTTANFINEQEIWALLDATAICPVSRLKP